MRDVTKWFYQLWFVPLLTIFNQDGEVKQQDFSFSKKSKLFHISGQTPKWIKLNPDQNSFVRVMYDDDGWTAIEDALKNNELKKAVSCLSSGLMV